MTASLPPDEEERLQALLRYEILDSPDEPEFDDFAVLASHICEVPVSLVSLVDTERQWFKSKVGLDVSETSRDSAFCAHTILSEQILEVSDALEDARFRENPLVTGEPRIRFYAGAPLITPDGYRLGSLCVIDREPRKLTEAQRDALARLSRQVVRLLELRRQKMLLKKAYSQLRELETFRDGLVQMVVHDLRSLLSGVIGCLELSLMHELPTEAVEDIESAQHASWELLEMINTLLDISRLESGEIALTLEAVDLGASIQSVIKALKPLIGEREITCTMPDIAEKTRCDRKLVERVLQNLIANAIKFTDKKSGRISVELCRENGKVSVGVCDNGPGIPPEHHKAVFDKFFQVSHENSTGHSTGLGLAFCKLAIESHGGVIAVENNKDQGCRFYFTIPEDGPKDS